MLKYVYTDLYFLHSMLLLLFNPLMSASWRATLENQERAVGRENIWDVCFDKLAAVMGEVFSGECSRSPGKNITL